jgi:hypothetical protein
MKFRSVLLAVIILIFVFATIERVDAAGPKTANRKVITANMDTKQLPKSFVGDNKNIVDIIDASYVEKSEYETNEAYKQRKKTLENKVYVFSHGLDEYKNETAYNAEEKALIITLSPSMPKSIYKSFHNLKKSYIGQNAFGAKTQVREGTIYEYMINMELPHCKFDFPMEPKQADIFRENIRILFWVKILDVECRKNYREATYDIPIDGALIKFTGKASIVEMWLYNFETGEIYKKLSSDGKTINF